MNIDAMEILKPVGPEVPLHNQNISSPEFLFIFQKRLKFQIHVVIHLGKKLCPALTHQLGKHRVVFQDEDQRNHEIEIIGNNEVSSDIRCSGIYGFERSILGFE